MGDGEGPTRGGARRAYPVARRAVLRAVGASSVVGLGVGSVAAQEGHGDHHGDESGGENGAGNGVAETPPRIDPLFGYASGGPNPCAGSHHEESDETGGGSDHPADCFASFPGSVRPTHEVEMHIGIPGLLFAVGGQGVLSDVTTQSIGEAVADGTVDRSELHRPRATVTVQTPDGPVDVTVEEIARLVAQTVGFHFEPAGLHVAPGDVVLYSAETPDHAVASYHERHGRQNRVPDGVGPFSSPLVPVGGYWLYRFDTPGVYDVYCPPHEPFGMVQRVVVSDGDVPEPSVEMTGRPPEDHNQLAAILGGLDPNVPSSAAALETAALSPAAIVERGAVPWADVVADHRSGGPGTPGS
ncbi:Copper binding protein, plastocyanin/azurin family [Halogeometricum limi]|uniref:Copper binding protein, plastocyanin/azurin family n=2 Tax=Halogeometricum limi TaxID=555875 RepID=A0A1I6I0Z2_9EURY|nr:Copper binding protein, plastocyanin/azurin family [Halogeometricum limi]